MTRDYLPEPELTPAVIAVSNRLHHERPSRPSQLTKSRGHRRLRLTQLRTLERHGFAIRIGGGLDCCATPHGVVR